MGPLSNKIHRDLPGAVCSIHYLTDTNPTTPAFAVVPRTHDRELVGTTLKVRTTAGGSQLHDARAAIVSYGLDDARQHAQAALGHDYKEVRALNVVHTGAPLCSAGEDPTAAAG